MWDDLTEMKKIVILFSGEGKNMEAILNKLHKKRVYDSDSCAGIEVLACITNRPDAKGLAIATEHKVSTVVLDHTQFESREAFDRKLVKIVQSYEPDLVVLAGFMRILTEYFTSQIRAINLHPSLLPLFKGAQAIERSFQSNESEGGVSIHYVTKELDAGSVIAQKSFMKSDDETLESFRGKIKSIEHTLLPETIKKVLCYDSQL